MAFLESVQRKELKLEDETGDFKFFASNILTAGR